MDLLIAYAMSFQGIPYIWGGSNPIQGFDCSGYVQWVLKFAGLDPLGDQGAAALHDHFEKQGSSNVWGPGALAFFGPDGKRIEHVGFCISAYTMVHARGGDSTCTTRQIAMERSACVRADLIRYRPDLISVIKPRYGTIGLI